MTVLSREYIASAIWTSVAENLGEGGGGAGGRAGALPLFEVGGCPPPPPPTSDSNEYSFHEII